MTPKLTKEYVERLRSRPMTDEVREAAEANREFERAVGRGEIPGDVVASTGPAGVDAVAPPPGPWPVRKVKEPPS